jgi:predicted ArsR family transcriptional regulator
MAFPNLEVPNLIGREKMRESKFMQEFMDEARREEGQLAVRTILEERFGKVTEHMRTQLGNIEDMDRLNQLIRVAVRSASLDEFRVELARMPATAR